jgi:hypothetical protein
MLKTTPKPLHPSPPHTVPGGVYTLQYPPTHVLSPMQWLVLLRHIPRGSTVPSFTTVQTPSVPPVSLAEHP